jgi:solute carrier family 25 (mitochondrial uncoupling protein), member 8/9
MQGLEAGIHRQLIFTGLRIGLYGNILDYFNEGKSREEAHVSTRTAAAMCTSALGITMANPSGMSSRYKSTLYDAIIVHHYMH